MQLRLVQLLRGAMANADKGAAAAAGHDGGAISPCPARSGPVLTPEPRYLPRPVLHPTPRYEPRPVIHPMPRFEPQPCPPDDCQKSAKSTLPAGPQPPWSLLPWQQPAPIPPKIKIIVRQPDITRRGTLIDFFC